MNSFAVTGGVSSSDAADVLSTIPGVSRLSMLDEPRFRRALQRQENRYAYSWLYMLRASHLPDGVLGYIYTGDHLLAGIGFRHGYVYVLPLSDTTRGATLQSLCDRIVFSTNLPVIIKKYDRTLYPLTTVREDYTLPLEDDICPETYLSLQKYFLLSGHINPTLHKLQRRARAFETAGAAIRIADDLRRIPLHKLEAFLARDSEKYLSYIQVLRYLYSHADTDSRYIARVYADTTSIRGLHMAERLAPSSIGLYGAITTKDEAGITEWMDLAFFRYLHDQKISTILLGGAENEGIAAYISRLVPYKPAYSVRSVQFVSKQPSTNVTRIRLAEERDIRSLADLYLAMYNNMGRLGETWTRESARKFISHFYRRQPDLFFVAEKRGEIVGAIVAAVQPWWDGNHLVEGELFAQPPLHDRSVTDCLLKKLLLEAAQRYDVVAWDTIAPTLRNHPLAEYEQIGFKAVQHWAAISGDVADILDHLA